ncbi:VOC family protein [Streptomyces sp. GESEQ-35]|uniref:VOC family protein n=1 Tax=Streptomyces sp. GESEQ-35 TaxID=2812657 RepID=UPI001B33B3BD|nr:VOC family protein [Streptomyces sp. GESEQ-35]
MKAADQFHVGLVVDDLSAAAAELSASFGYEWSAEMGAAVRVTLPAGDAVLDLRSVYSTTSPRLELVRSVPGSLWQPADSGVHHLGYWSDDVAADSAELARRGSALEALGKRPDSTPYWAFHRSGTGPRIELVSRELHPVLEQFWTTGGTAS